MPVARRSSSAGARQRLSPGSGKGITSHPSAVPTQVDAAQPRTPDPDQAPSGTERRPVVKAPATKSAKPAKSAAASAKGRSSAAKAAVPAARKPAAKSAARPAAKAAVKPVSKTAPKPAAKAAAKVTCAKRPAKVTQPVAKGPVKSKAAAPIQKSRFACCESLLQACGQNHGFEQTRCRRQESGCTGQAHAFPHTRGQAHSGEFRQIQGTARRQGGCSHRDHFCSPGGLRRPCLQSCQRQACTGSSPRGG